MVSLSKTKRIPMAFSASDLKAKSCLSTLFITASLILSLYLIGGLRFTGGGLFKGTFLGPQAIDLARNLKPSRCKNRNRSRQTESLPEGIVARTSNLEMQPLWSSGLTNKIKKASKSSLLAVAVGIKQKELVDKIISKFSETPSGFTIMVFHYDGVVDEWRDMPWNDEVIHISAKNQTKWWFAKRFLHPDIVAEYEYIFLWDEDLDVEKFNPKRYISIIKDEGLEISQPALDRAKSKVNHKITIQVPKLRVHRKTFHFKRRSWCFGNAPPCTGWVEMMAPVFSRAAWRCSWYMIQNDLIHAWGLDMKLGYCAQGDRMKKVGVVDEEYVAHLGLPTLGGTAQTQNISKTRSSQQQFSEAEAKAPSESQTIPSVRQMVRKQSFTEMQIFNKRWERAVKKDSCWIDPYKKASSLTVH